MYPALTWLSLTILIIIRQRLKREQQEESHHKTEETHSLGQGETQNGVREELLLQRRVSGVADDKTAEDGADTGTGSGDTDGGSAGADELGR